MLPLVMAVVAAGGYIQVADQDIFWCGRVEAFPGTTMLAVLSLAQVALYLAAMARARWERLYHLSQFAVLPFLVVAFLPVLLPHPWTLGLLSTYAAAIAWLERGGRKSESRDQTNTWSRMAERTRCHPAPGRQHGGVFAVATLGYLAAIGQIPLTLHGVILPGWMAWAALAAATALAAWTATRSARPAYANIGQLIPLTLLLFPLLRARLPDIAYDSLSYKVTIPYQMAEWRTGDTAIVDGYMIGTNLQEMLNALLRILTGDWRPQLISSISYILLALIIPCAFPAGQFPRGARRAAVAFAGVAAFVLTEAGIAQGTAYQEPLLLLFMVAALIRCPLWPGFLGMAAAVKITAVFIAPLILLYHAVNYRSFWRSPRFLLLGVLAGTLALGPQLSRNLTFSGRLLGMSEILAGVTDPPGPHQIMAVGIDRYDVRPRGGVINNAIQSACNVWLLDALCSVRYKGNFEAGFSVFPASRAALLAVLFGVAACLRRRRPVACLALGGFAAGYAGLLAIVSEGRYFLPLSLGFPVMLLIDPKLAASMARRPWALALGCWLIGADLLPGTFTNASWICRRDIAAAVDNPPLLGSQTPVQGFLASLTEQYKQRCAPPGLPPVILAETDRMNSPYLGTQRIFHVFTQAMIGGFIAANPARQTRMGDAILAVVDEHPGYAEQVLGSSRADFRPCFDDDGLHVLCSMRLAPNGPDCAQSLY